MFFLFHLIFELFKISLLSCIYALLVVVIIKRVAKYSNNKWFISIAKRRFRLWFLSGFVISVFLFSFLFSYWGNHGLGDDAYIPIGYGKTVEQIDGTRAYIRPEGHGYETMAITDFSINTHYLLGKPDVTKDTAKICVWDLETNQVQLMDNDELNKFIILNNIKKPLIYEDFDTHYNRYWNGWRFWLLG